MKQRIPFDAKVRQLLDEQAAAAGVPPSAMSNEERVRMARSFMVRVLQSRTSITGLPNGVESREIEINPALSARLYLPPDGREPLSVLVYMHGGGWVVGSVAIFEPFCRLLSEAAGVTIVSVEYRLAPEYPYPAGVEDSIAAVRWVAEHASEWGGDPTRIALGGDSAGANLAGAAAIRLRAAGELDPLQALMLLYPVTDHPSAGHPSYEENARGYGLDAHLMHWFWEQYTANVSPKDPNVSLLQLLEVPDLPPTLVATAEYDILRDEGIAFAQKLKVAGVNVTHLHAPDMGHNFPVTPNLVGRFPQCVETLAEIADWLKRTLSAADKTSLHA